MTVLTPEEIMNTVYTKLLEQGEPCMEAGMCVYENNKGQRCAAGWLLNDDELEAVRDAGLNSGSSFADLQDLVREELTEHSGLILHLQEVHDCYHENTRLRFRSWGRYLSDEFNKVAEGFRVNFNPPPNWG